MWDGYLTLAGQEIINGPRTEAYAEAAGATWLLPQFEAPQLASMLGHADYSTPLLDTAPWVDPDVPESYDFFGLYPLDISGIEDSSRTAEVIESTVDGGVLGNLRHGTKAIVIAGALVGANEKAVAYGMKWLRRALLGNVCDDLLDHGGDVMTFLSSEPLLQPGQTPQPALKPLIRSLRNVSVNSGPTVTSKRSISTCEGEVWTVTFTAIAGKPSIFGAEQPIMQGWLTGATGGDVIPNLQPDSSFELESATWIISGNGTLSFVDDEIAPHGSIVARLQATGTGSPYVRSSGAVMVPVTAGQVGDFATAYASMRWDSANTPKPVRLDVAFYNSSNVLVGTVQNGPTFTPDEFAYIRTQNNGNVIPANTAWVSIRATIPSSVTGDAIRVDAVTVTITDTDPSSTPANWPEYAPKDTTVLNPDPWVPGVTPGTFQNTPTVFAEVECGDDLWEPIYDPLCPALTVPPTPPSIPLGCFDPPASWDRRKVTLPAEHVPLWSEMAPVVTLSTTDAQRNIRLRFYRDPTESLDPNATPCAWDEDLVISYIPAQGVMIIDAAAEEVWVETVTGQRRRADSLIYTTEGKPFEWPVLACGDQHIITLDTPVGVTPPVIDLTLVPRTI